MVARPDSELRPVSLYAETKVAVERFLLDQPRSNHCAPTSLRFSTVYGRSPRMRFDLTDLRLFPAEVDAGSITKGAAEASLFLSAASERLRNI